MKKTCIILSLTLLLGVLTPHTGFAKIFHMQQSSAAHLKYTWRAFNNGEYKKAIEYAEGCIFQYSKKAKLMQERLTDFVKGEEHEIHAYYALNDVATAYYIKGVSYQKLGNIEEARKAYQELIDSYSFGQCFDPRGWFWKPSYIAKEKIYLLDQGLNIDYRDYSSMSLMELAWKALDERDEKAVMLYTKKCIKLYDKKARKMQAELDDFVQDDASSIHAQWALNDVATAHFIQGEMYLLNKKPAKARRAYEKIVNHYSFAQCWDPRGWFWRVKDAAKIKMSLIESKEYEDYASYSYYD